MAAAAVERVATFNRRTLDVLSARLYSYLSLAHERTGSLPAIRRCAGAALRAAVLQHPACGVVAAGCQQQAAQPAARRMPPLPLPLPHPADGAACFWARRTAPLLLSMFCPLTTPTPCPARLLNLRSLLLGAHRTATLRHDELGAETLLNLLLRNYLEASLIDQVGAGSGWTAAACCSNGQRAVPLAALLAGRRRNHPPL